MCQHARKSTIHIIHIIHIIIDSRFECKLTVFQRRRPQKPRAVSRFRHDCQNGLESASDNGIKRMPVATDYLYMTSTAPIRANSNHRRLHEPSAIPSNNWSASEASTPGISCSPWLKLLLEHRRLRFQQAGWEFYAGCNSIFVYKQTWNFRRRYKASSSHCHTHGRDWIMFEPVSICAIWSVPLLYPTSLILSLTPYFNCKHFAIYQLQERMSYWEEAIERSAMERKNNA